MAFPNTNFISRVTVITAQWLQAVNDFIVNFIANYASEDVSSYGAVGDGVTDDTVALNLALASSLNLNFGNESKNYKVTGSLLVRSYARLYGRGARIFQATKQTPLFDVRNKVDWLITGFTATGYLAEDVGAGSLTIGVRYTIRTPGTTNFTLIGAADNTIGTAFVATGPGSGTGVASTFYNTPSSLDIGVYATGCTNGLVVDNKFYGFNYSPINVASGGTNITFKDNLVIGPGLGTLTTNFRNCTGCTIVTTDGIIISGNTISETSEGIIVGQGSSRVLVQKNIIRNTRVEHGMYLDTGLVDTSVIGNVVTNAALVGIKFQWYDSYGVRPSNLIIADNVVENAAGGDGIVVLNVNPATIANITAITQANPGVITTSAPHGLSVDDKIETSAIGGMTSLIGSWFVASTPTASTLTVKTSGAAINTSGFAAYTTGGTIARPLYLDTMSITGNTVRGSGQDGISIRYVEGGIVADNVVIDCDRYGYGQLNGLNIDVHGNRFTDTQYNGIFADVPLTPCTFVDNSLKNVGAAGDDTAGGSSGIYIQGDGGGEVRINKVRGESTQTKMRYGVQLAAGDKTQWSILNNIIDLAQDGMIALHTATTNPLRLFDGNVGTSAAGNDLIPGLAQAIPSRGNPNPDYWGTAAPTTGTWQQGTNFTSLYAQPGKPRGWLNTVAGSPGTWSPHGIVHKVSATQNLSGSYSPAEVGLSGNVTGAVSFGAAQYQVIGDTVVVRGTFTLTQSIASGNTTFRMSLPISTTFAAAADSGECGGTGSARTVSQSWSISNDGTNNAAYFQGFSNATGSLTQTASYMLSYRII